MTGEGCSLRSFKIRRTPSTYFSWLGICSYNTHIYLGMHHVVGATFVVQQTFRGLRRREGSAIIAVGTSNAKHCTCPQ